MNRIILFALIIISAFRSSAQIDPTLAGMILLYDDKAKKALKSQESAMLLMTTGHIWTREEVEATTDLQRIYNEYLDRFNDIIVYAAQIYGFYHEVGKLTENFGQLTRQLRQSPSNALAVALTPKRNSIYREVIMASVDIVNDIRQVCLSEIKMTEKQRVEIVFGIRPKLKLMNRKLSRLARAVKYTSLNDVWLELDNRAREPIDKGSITDAAFRRWRQSGRVSINPGSGGNGAWNGNNQWIVGPWIRPPQPWIKDSLIVRPIGPTLRDSIIITTKPKGTR